MNGKIGIQYQDNVGEDLNNKVNKTGGDTIEGIIKIGNASNYVQFGTNGRMTMVGTARVEEQEKIHSTAAAKGSSAPTDALRAIGASGTVLKPVIKFSKTIQEDVYFEFHAPYALDLSSPVHFHLVWLPGTAWTTGNYMWKLEYLLRNENDPYNTGTPTTISADVTPLNSVNIIETEFIGDILFTNDDQILCCHFYRDVANDNADDTGDVNMFEIHFTKNKQGL